MRLPHWRRPIRRIRRRDSRNRRNERGAQAHARNDRHGEGVHFGRRGARPRPAAAAADRITLNRERLLLDAKAQAVALAEAGYAAPQPRTQIPAPGHGALAVLETGIFLMGEAGFASEHDMKVARWVAYILCGGRVTAGALVSEQYLLDLEREAFLSLCGERKTQERIAYTLKTGKPLRN